MHVLVTGSKGYIGAVLTCMMKEVGFDVVGLDSDLYEQCTFGQWTDAVPLVRKDIRDVEAPDLEGFDAIVHLAGLSDDSLGALVPQLTYEINHGASVRLAALAKSVGVSRFFFASSRSIYGNAGDNLVNEESVFNPVTPHVISKVRVEQDVAKLADADFSPTFLRVATVYGVSPHLCLDLVLNNLVAWPFTSGRFYIKGDGIPWRPPVHIEDIHKEDVCQGFIVTLRAPREVVHNQAFILGRDGGDCRISDLAKIVRQTVPSCQIEYTENPNPDCRCCRADFSKIARTLPDFKPRWDVKRGAEEPYEAYKKMDLKHEEFMGARYRRIDHIKRLLGAGRPTRQRSSLERGGAHLFPRMEGDRTPTFLETQ